ncbi:MarR family winged helix-turn-helix transcriptional regulator [Parasphingorhabdus sp.]|uniref:MarR family winged helix-turn-helix transcriptional regulator n=1 Tax=Parasphingorhabdus sp. TaxID=2709688 RepID=UPI002F95343E
MKKNQLIIALFQRFCWMDEGLQSRLHERGWPDVSRSQSMVMTNIVSGIVRPSDIARNIGISRQAIHSTINQMEKLGILQLKVDPKDRRHVILELTETGKQMRRDAQLAMDSLTTQISNILGQEKFDAMLDALDSDWGDNINHDIKRNA